MKKFFQKSFLSALTFLYFLTNCALAHALETNLWKERLSSFPNVSIRHPRAGGDPGFNPSLKNKFYRLDSRLRGNDVLSFLQQFGSVRKVSQGPSARTLIHIQDVHLNTEAQRNISAATRALLDQSKIDVIGIEGAFNKIEISDLKKYPDPEARQLVIDYLLRENRIGGVVHGALSSSRDVDVIGVDDQEHYNANVQAYRDSLAPTDHLKKSWAKIEQEVQSQAAQIFNPQLKEFHQNVEAFHQGQKSFGAYLRQMSEGASHVSLPIETFLAATQLEESLDFNRVNLEREHLLSRLISKLNQADQQNLMEQSRQFSSGELSYADFYQSLKKLVESHGLSWSQYPTMQTYIQYVLLSDSLRGDRLLSEAQQLEASQYQALAQNKSERQLIKKLRQIYLTKKLIEFSLTPEEWGEYSSSETLREDDLKSFEQFYLEAAIRNKFLAKNLLHAMDQSKATTAILITGGFHTEGLQPLLKDSGLTIINFTPKISKIDSADGSSYLSVFAQRQTPLDQLFTGEKLFTAPPTQISPLDNQLAEVSTTFLDELKPTRWGNTARPTSPLRPFIKKISDLTYSVTRSGQSLRLKFTREPALIDVSLKQKRIDAYVYKIAPLLESLSASIIFFGYSLGWARWIGFNDPLSLAAFGFGIYSIYRFLPPLYVAMHGERGFKLNPKGFLVAGQQRTTEDKVELENEFKLNLQIPAYSIFLIPLSREILLSLHKLNWVSFTAMLIIEFTAVLIATIMHHQDRSVARLARGQSALAMDFSGDAYKKYSALVDELAAALNRSKDVARAYYILKTVPDKNQQHRLLGHIDSNKLVKRTDTKEILATMIVNNAKDFEYATVSWASQNLPQFEGSSSKKMVPNFEWQKSIYKEVLGFLQHSNALQKALTTNDASGLLDYARTYRNLANDHSPNENFITAVASIILVGRKHHREEQITRLMVATVDPNENVEPGPPESFGIRPEANKMFQAMLLSLKLDADLNNTPQPNFDDLNAGFYKYSFENPRINDLANYFRSKTAVNLEFDFDQFQSEFDHRFGEGVTHTIHIPLLRLKAHEFRNEEKIKLMARTYIKNRLDESDYFIDQLADRLSNLLIRDMRLSYPNNPPPPPTDLGFNHMLYARPGDEAYEGKIADQKGPADDNSSLSKDAFLHFLADMKNGSPNLSERAISLQPFKLRSYPSGKAYVGLALGQIIVFQLVPKSAELTFIPRYKSENNWIHIEVWQQFSDVSQRVESFAITIENSKILISKTKLKSTDQTPPKNFSERRKAIKDLLDHATSLLSLTDIYETLKSRFPGVAYTTFHVDLIKTGLLEHKSYRRDDPLISFLRLDLGQVSKQLIRLFTKKYIKAGKEPNAAELGRLLNEEQRNISRRLHWLRELGYLPDGWLLLDMDLSPRIHEFGTDDMWKIEQRDLVQAVLMRMEKYLTSPMKRMIFDQRILPALFGRPAESTLEEIGSLFPSTRNKSGKLVREAIRKIEEGLIEKMFKKVFRDLGITAEDFAEVGRKGNRAYMGLLNEFVNPILKKLLTSANVQSARLMQGEFKPAKLESEEDGQAIGNGLMQDQLQKLKAASDPGLYQDAEGTTFVFVKGLDQALASYLKISISYMLGAHYGLSRNVIYIDARHLEAGHEADLRKQLRHEILERSILIRTMNHDHPGWQNERHKNDVEYLIKRHSGKIHETLLQLENKNELEQISFDPAVKSTLQHLLLQTDPQKRFETLAEDLSWMDQFLWPEFIEALGWMSDHPYVIDLIKRIFLNPPEGNYAFRSWLFEALAQDKKGDGYTALQFIFQRLDEESRLDVVSSLSDLIVDQSTQNTVYRRLIETMNLAAKATSELISISPTFKTDVRKISQYFTDLITPLQLMLRTASGLDRLELINRIIQLKDNYSRIMNVGDPGDSIYESIHNYQLMKTELIMAYKKPLIFDDRKPGSSKGPALPPPGTHQNMLSGPEEISNRFIARPLTGPENDRLKEKVHAFDKSFKILVDKKTTDLSLKSSAIVSIALLFNEAPIKLAAYQWQRILNTIESLSQLNINDNAFIGAATQLKRQAEEVRNIQHQQKSKTNKPKSNLKNSATPMAAQKKFPVKQQSNVEQFMAIFKEAAEYPNIDEWMDELLASAIKKMSDPDPFGAVKAASNIIFDTTTKSFGPYRLVALQVLTVFILLERVRPSQMEWAELMMKVNTLSVGDNFKAQRILENFKNLAQRHLTPSNSGTYVTRDRRGFQNMLIGPDETHGGNQSGEDVRSSSPSAPIFVLRQTIDIRELNGFNEVISQYVLEGSWIEQIIYSPDGRYVAMAFQDKHFNSPRVAMVDIKKGYLLWTQSFYEGSIQKSISDITFTPDGNNLLVAFHDQFPIRQLDTLTGTVPTPSLPQIMTTKLAFGADDRLFTFSSKGTLDVLKKQNLLELDRHNGYGYSMAVQNHVVATGSQEPAVHVVDGYTGKLLAKFTDVKTTIQAIDIDPSGQLVAFSPDTTVYLWDWKQNKIFFEFPFHHGTKVSTIQFLPDGQHLVVILEAPGKMKVLNLKGEEVFSQDFGKDSLFDRDYSAALRPDGRELIVSGNRGRGIQKEELLYIFDTNLPASPSNQTILSQIESIDSTMKMLRAKKKSLLAKIEKPKPLEPSTETAIDLILNAKGTEEENQNYLIVHDWDQKGLIDKAKFARAIAYASADLNLPEIARSHRLRDICTALGMEALYKSYFNIRSIQKPTGKYDIKFVIPPTKGNNMISGPEEIFGSQSNDPIENKPLDWNDHVRMLVEGIYSFKEDVEASISLLETDAEAAITSLQVSFNSMSKIFKAHEDVIFHDKGGVHIVGLVGNPIAGIPQVWKHPYKPQTLISHLRAFMNRMDELMVIIKAGRAHDVFEFFVAGSVTEFSPTKIEELRKRSAHYNWKLNESLRDQYSQMTSAQLGKILRALFANDDALLELISTYQDDEKLIVAFIDWLNQKGHANVIWAEAKTESEQAFLKEVMRRWPFPLHLSIATWSPKVRHMTPDVPDTTPVSGVAMDLTNDAISLISKNSPTYESDLQTVAKWLKEGKVQKERVMKSAQQRLTLAVTILTDKNYQKNLTPERTISSLITISALKKAFKLTLNPADEKTIEKLKQQFAEQMSQKKAETPKLTVDPAEEALKKLTSALIVNSHDFNKQVALHAWLRHIYRRRNMMDFVTREAEFIFSLAYNYLTAVSKTSPPETVAGVAALVQFFLDNNLINPNKKQLSRLSKFVKAPQQIGQPQSGYETLLANRDRNFQYNPDLHGPVLAWPWLYQKIHKHVSLNTYVYRIAPVLESIPPALALPITAVLFFVYIPEPTSFGFTFLLLALIGVALIFKDILVEMHGTKGIKKIDGQLMDGQDFTAKDIEKLNRGFLDLHMSMAFFSWLAIPIAINKLGSYFYHHHFSEVQSIWMVGGVVALVGLIGLSLFHLRLSIKNLDRGLPALARSSNGNNFNSQKLKKAFKKLFKNGGMVPMPEDLQKLTNLPMEVISDWLARPRDENGDPQKDNQAEKYWQQPTKPKGNRSHESGFVSLPFIFQKINSQPTKLGINEAFSKPFARIPQHRRERQIELLKISHATEVQWFVTQAVDWQKSRGLGPVRELIIFIEPEQAAEEQAIVNSIQNVLSRRGGTNAHISFIFKSQETFRSSTLSEVLNAAHSGTASTYRGLRKNIFSPTSAVVSVFKTGDDQWGERAMDWEGLRVPVVGAVGYLLNLMKGTATMVPIEMHMLINLEQKKAA